MEKVLNITDRLEDKKRKQQLALYRQQVETIQRIVQCASCHLRCAMCGCHLKGAEASCPVSSSRGFTLCQSCDAEFQDFLKMTKGRRRKDIFWHNQEWLDLWSAWLDYQNALRAFRRSPEFHEITTKSED